MTKPSIRFSRSGTTSLFGKLTAMVPAVRISEETKDRLDALASQAGLPWQEFHRQLLEERAHGQDMVKKLFDARMVVISGKLKETS